MELALSMEAAEKNSRTFKGGDSSIKKIQGPLRSKFRSQQPCLRCGKSNHAAKDCKFKDATCHSCGKKGHIAPACRTKPATKPLTTQKHCPTRSQRTNLVQQDASDSDTEEFYMFKLSAPAAFSHQSHSICRREVTYHGVRHRSGRVNYLRCHTKENVPRPQAPEIQTNPEDLH